MNYLVFVFKLFPSYLKFSETPKSSIFQFSIIFNITLSFLHIKNFEKSNIYWTNETDPTEPFFDLMKSGLILKKKV